VDCVLRASSFHSNLHGELKMTATKKDDLYQEALEKHDVKLDRRLSLDQLQDQINRLQSSKNNPKKEVKTPVPKFVKNVITGNVFEYNELFAGNPDLQVIEWESDDGDN
jgi:protein subunit release factor B